jgi:para-nitrobenzyl esterase
MRFAGVRDVRSGGALALVVFGWAKLVIGVATVTALAAVFQTGAIAAQTAAPACTANTLVNTENGPMCGMVKDGGASYLGVPFAAPPVGPLRWQPPAPVAAWTTAFQATQAGPSCPQAPFPIGSNVNAMTNEDCLTLNVYVPANAGPGLPVMVEIHGGGFVIGAPPNGAHLAASGHVIVVAIHYRLGILGFLVNKALGEHSGDYGLLDQIAALRWVQRNIARFGGDAHNVTLFGQSAGGASVCDAIVSPVAVGLFQTGISESGFYNYNVNTIWSARGDCKSELLTEAKALQLGEAFAKKVGCGTAADMAACLRALPARTLVDQGGQVSTPEAGGTIGPTINSAVLPVSPAMAFKTGRFPNKIPLMIGVTRDEFNGGLYTSQVANTPAQYQEMLQQQFGDRTSKVMSLYPVARFPNSSPFIAHRTVMADAFSVCPALVADQQLARHIPVYAFENDNAATPQGNAARRGALPLGAFHNGENPFLFPSATLTLDANQAVFGDQIIAQWAGFARTGNPTVDGAPDWPPYSKGRRVMSLVPAGNSALIPTATLNLQHNCDFWNTVNRTAPWTKP